MPHFIDEAQEREKEINKNIQEENMQQSEFVKQNTELFLPFHKIVASQIEKIAALNAESRRPVIEIGFTHLENDGNFEYYASSYRPFVRKKYWFIKKEKIFIWWRRIIITICEKPDTVKITLYEKGYDELDYTDVIKKKTKIYAAIHNLNEQTSLWMMDFLGYKIPIHELIQHIPHEENHHH